MARTILAVLAGVLVAGLVVAGIEMAAHALSQPAGIPMPGGPMPDGITPPAPDQAPVTVLINVVLAWALGSIAGGFTASKISRQHTRAAPVAVGVLMVVLVVSNFFVMPHPVWMMVLGVLLPVPMALIGRKLASIRGR